MNQYNVIKPDNNKITVLADYYIVEDGALIFLCIEDRIHTVKFEVPKNYWKEVNILDK